jgi:hypothetical protein
LTDRDNLRGLNQAPSPNWPTSGRRIILPDKKNPLNQLRFAMKLKGLYRTGPEVTEFVITLATGQYKDSNFESLYLSQILCGNFEPFFPVFCSYITHATRVFMM